jgi:tRNA (guanine-N7-)-methyltransferase
MTEAGVDLKAELIRTFKHRRGRITAGQQKALDSLWSAYGIDIDTEPLDQHALFGRVAPLVLDIGFGMGETTLAMALADPARDIIAVDVHTPGAGALLRAIDELQLGNIRVVVADVRELFAGQLEPESLDEVRVFFPDPWPKAKHHKRRLLGADFVQLAARALRPGGALHVATDWKPYAIEVLAITSSEPLLVNNLGGFAPRPASRPITRFEQQGLKKGHLVYDIVCGRAG